MGILARLVSRWPLAYATPWPHLHVQSQRDCENCNARLRAQSCCCYRRVAAADVAVAAAAAAAVNNIAQRQRLRKFVSSMRDCRTMGQAHSIEVFAMAEVSGFQIPDSRSSLLHVLGCRTLAHCQLISSEIESMQFSCHDHGVDRRQQLIWLRSPAID